MARKPKTIAREPAADADAPSVTEMNPPSPPAALGGDAPAALPAAEAAGPTSTDNPPSEDREGGAGNPAGPAADLSAWMVAGGVEDVKLRYPLTAAALSAWAERQTGETMPEIVVRISAKREGFRRAGMAHSKAATEHPLSRFTPDQVEELLAEPNLMVELA